jgi:hypothetical protein
MKFKEVIAVNNKLEKVCDRYVTVLNNTLKPTKPFYTIIFLKKMTLCHICFETVLNLETHLHVSINH